MTRRLALALAALSLISGCGHTQLTLRGASLLEVSTAVQAGWAPGATQTVEASQESLRFEGHEGDNGASTLVAISTLGLYCPGRLHYAVEAQGEDGDVQLSIRASRWTQILYVVPVITRYPALEEDLAERIQGALEQSD